MPAPANDNFASAQTLVGDSGNFDADNTDATRETPDPIVDDHGNGVETIWFTFTPSADGNLDLWTEDQPGGPGLTDTSMAIYSGSALGSLTELGYNDDTDGAVHTSGTFSELIAVPVEEGITYRIAITGYSDGLVGTFRLSWALTPPPPPPPPQAILIDNSVVQTPFARVNLGAAYSEVWVTFDLRASAAALAFWEANNVDLVDLGVGAGVFAELLLTLGAWTFLGAAGGAPSPGACQTIELHYVAGSVAEIYIEGTLVDSASPGTSTNPDSVYFAVGYGASQNDPASLAHYRRMKIGTTRGGSDLFEWNGVDLSQFFLTDGDLSVVPDPCATSPAILARVFSPDRFYEAPPWRIVVSDLDDRTLTYLDHLAMDRSITVTRAAARVMSCRVPSDNPEVNIPNDGGSLDQDPFVAEGTRIVSWFRREGRVGSTLPQWRIRGRGLVLDVDDAADSDHATSTVTAYDPWKYLYRRPVLLADGSYPGEAGRVYAAGARASDIIVEQFTLAETYGTPIFTDYGLTSQWAGTIETTDPLPDGGDGLAVKFAAGTSLGEMLDTLVATGTCDVVFDPVYDPVLRPGVLCDLSIYQSAGEFQAEAIFGWDSWPRSLVQLSRQTDGTARMNRARFFAGQGGPPVPEEDDAVSIAKFGDYWGSQYLPGVPSIAGAHTIAQRQLALLKDGQLTYALTPAAERAPLLFQEYREADTVPVYASKRFRAAIPGDRVRIESIPVVIGDDQLERVNQMLVSFSPETGS